MRMPNQPSQPKKKGRPATGKAREKISVSVPIPLIGQAKRAAAQRGESFSNYVARAIQNQVLQIL